MMLGRYPRHFPWFALAITAAVAVISLVGNVGSAHVRLVQLFALNWNDLVDLQWYRILTSPLVQTKEHFDWTILLLLTAFVPWYEMLEGSSRAVAVFFFGDALSTLAALIVFRVLATLGDGKALLWTVERDSGASSGCFASLGALAVALHGWQRVAVLAIGLGIHVVRLVVRHHEADYQHLAAWLTGIAVAALLEQLLLRRPFGVGSQPADSAADPA